MELKQLDQLELKNLYEKIVSLRQEVVKIVDEYGFSASSLVSRTFEKEIEQEYGRKELKKMCMIKEIVPPQVKEHT